MKAIDFLAEDSKGYKVKTWIPAPHVESTILYYRAFLDFEGPLKGTACTIMGRKVRCYAALAVKNVIRRFRLRDKEVVPFSHSSFMQYTFAARHLHDGVNTFKRKAVRLLTCSYCN